MKISQKVFNSQSGHEYILKMIKFNVEKAITPKESKPKLRFICSARCLMVLYIGVTFRVNITNGIRVMERAKEYGIMAMFNVRRAITQKVGKSELRFMCSPRCLIVLYIGVKFYKNISNGITVMERTRNYEALTD